MKQSPDAPDAPEAIETALYTLAARQSTLAELGILALGAKSLQALLDEAVVSMRTTLDADACTVLELVPGGESLMVRADVGWGESLKGLLVDAGTGSQSGYTLLASEPVVVEDISKETRFTVSSVSEAHGIRSGMTVIIHGRGRPWGVFSVLYRECRRFTREEVDYFQAAANVLALAAERLQTEEGLRRSEESFRSLIEHAPEGVLIRREGTIVYVNRALWGYLGHDGPEGLLGRPALDIVHPEDRARDERRSQAMKVSLSPAPPEEVRLLRRDGTTVLAEIAGVPIVFDGQRSLAAMIRDITERKKIEARLQQSERLSSLGVLAAGVAHEINNPLMYVLGNLDFARKGLSELGRPQAPAPADGESARLEKVRDIADLVDKARDGGERVRRIVADLKAFSRTGEGDGRSMIDVREVMASSISIARNEIRHRAQLVVEEGDVPRVMATDSRLGQVFLNLLLNAAHAIPDGAAHGNKITVRIQSRVPGWVVIEVQDTGVGIPEEIQGRLFDPFFTTKPVGVGTGLGLAICHEIVAALGGEIAVESELGRGACFRVTLPAARTPAAKTEPAPRDSGEGGDGVPSSRRAERPRGRVLVIDDEPFIAGLCRRALEAEHDVEVATSALAALSFIEVARNLDVILCDLMMPDTSGMELYEIVLGRFPALGPRFVFFSGGTFTPAARSFRERVSNPFLDKPCSPALLRETVRERVLLVRSGQD